MNGVPVFESGLLRLDLVEASDWLSGRAGGQSECLALARERTLGGVKGGSRDALALIEYVEDSVGMNTCLLYTSRCV